ncbi:assimilatory sulfite reductase (NADPH) flavoprotein subunit [Lederbergia sp. NSJ-179]|uniref:assimilatory sulfite reductase (NADPH) flavoprotein subunit n=1 Tax=Lederbergia sp. NSJ-179 TaxID=2931402 RepID=UPI001FD4CD5B|nr:assimilatory sulfite reductase (NADPH) flavoprotein subunit [Lederbergia sp. NSJ-179]MCJ7841199.1 assimilatory sulfite reductase (NADPH) flavoprotein subunit [Lederbergia sp. NSJ-179]
MQLQAINSPFSQEQIEVLNQVLPTLTEGQQLWLSGYLTASYGNTTLTASKNGISQLQPSVAAENKQKTKEVTILYGSQTGNGQRLAEELSQRLGHGGYQVTLSSMNEFKTNQLKKLSFLFLIVSTHGEGDPPDNAIPFYDFLNGRRAPKLNDLYFSVLSLGDSSYEFFCETGKKMDQRLEELGGKRICPRVDCDLDFDEPAAEWFDSVTNQLNELLLENSGSSQISPAQSAHLSVEESSYSRKNPFKAEVLENINLNGRGSNKETRHLELLIEDSGFEFKPGDSLGIYPENDPELVDFIMAELGWHPEELVSINKQGEKRPLQEALRHHFEITVLTKPLLEKMAQIHPHERLAELLKPEHKEELKAYMEARDLLDMIRDFSPWDIQPEPFVQHLRKMPARLYSIASSYQANPEEVHLTISKVRYEAHSRLRHGVCSVQCAERIRPGDYLPVYVHENPNFKLPEDPDAPIIMIGPGTGVAPFRAFLEEREVTEATGKSWLFFGDQHYVTDFLYQIDWQRWLKIGTLTQMDIAFSRDTEEKVYVQHRMLEKKQELYKWLKEGAYLYICGDEKHMAHDVHATLLTILEEEGGMTSKEAEEYLTQLLQEKRYQRDVY